jgi:chromate transporter
VIIGSVALFLECIIGSVFFPAWQNLQKFTIIYRALKGINAVVGIMAGATFYLMKDISIVEMSMVKR